MPGASRREQRADGVLALAFAGMEGRAIERQRACWGAGDITGIRSL
jgi:hypothetical protein